MPRRVELSADLRPLAARVGQTLGKSRAADLTTRLVVERAPDERLALAFLLELAEKSPEPLRRAFADPKLAGDLVFCVGSSEMAAVSLTTMGDEWLEFFEAARSRNDDSPPWPKLPDAAHIVDEASAARVLAGFKHRAFVAIAIADLLRATSVVGTMRAMSRLADDCITVALEAATRLMGARAGDAGEFCVLAMGKLGARELNLSSDIDLVYLCAAPASNAAQEAAQRLGETLTELLSTNCFRVDLRLRPGGRNSPLVASIDGALGFYQSLGQTWERAALLRAREVAGALAIGRRFLVELGPFIYRRYLDFDTLRQLRAMKRQIEEELRAPDAVRRNIKLGVGGIRELEFIVQALTLVYGGRDPRLRGTETIATLERLGALGYLDPERARELAEAYLFLRDVEHKLQVVAGLQTHSLPDDETGMRALAARMGFGKSAEALKNFEAALEKHRQLVAALFKEMLTEGAEREGGPASPEARATWQSAFDRDEAARGLAALGFAAPDESAGHLTLLAAGPEHAPSSPRRRELLDSLGPRLLDEIGRLSDPDLALMNLASFIAAVGARTSFLALLEQHPATRLVLLKLFASSRYLSALFIRHAEMLDTLVRSDLARLKRTPEELTAELSGLLAACEDFESRLDALRSFRHQEFLRVAIADLGNDLELGEVQTELTSLAEAVVRDALEIARNEIAARVAIPSTLRLCVVAMGRLGAGEMTYNSDLDLIFVYHDSKEVASSAREPATRITQKLIAVLETRTREGYAYKIDVRLRPSGYAGPLVTSLDGFREYHRQSSAVWERQALVRGRVIAGDESLGREVEAAREEFVFARGLDAQGVAEIAAMRARMEHEIGVEDKHRLNIKQGRGGLVDVEFLAQMMALRHGREHPRLKKRATLDLLRAIAESGLIAEADFHALESGHLFLSRLENRLRIESDQPAWALTTEPRELGRIARRLGYEGEDAAARILDDLQEQRDKIRAIFDRCFEAEQHRTT